uniref:Cytochrome b n=1 Tax=Engystomops pustulosus TaxID=76066 RepID=A0AAV6YKH9_ENGPU|nr:hypothetical protein GDO81_027910 [Engystomops pustulosus]
MSSGMYMRQATPTILQTPPFSARFMYQSHAVLGSISDIIHKSLLITIKTVNPTNIFAHSYLGNNDLSWGIPVHI